MPYISCYSSLVGNNRIVHSLNSTNDIYWRHNPVCTFLPCDIDRQVPFIYSVQLPSILLGHNVGYWFRDSLKNRYKNERSKYYSNKRLTNCPYGTGIVKAAFIAGIVC